MTIFIHYFLPFIIIFLLPVIANEDTRYIIPERLRKPSSEENVPVRPSNEQPKVESKIEGKKESIGDRNKEYQNLINDMRQTPWVRSLYYIMEALQSMKLLGYQKTVSRRDYLRNLLRLMEVTE